MSSDRCDRCGCLFVDSDTCQCGKAVKDHEESDGHTAVPVSTCMCEVPVDTLLQQLSEDVQALEVRTRSERKVFDLLWLMTVTIRRQQDEFKKLWREVRGPLPEHPDADYDGIEEAYSPNSVRMCYQCMTTHRPSEKCAPWPKKDSPFANTEPPPADKETRLFQDPSASPQGLERQFPEEETNVAINVPCKHCGNFPETDETGCVWCTCPNCDSGCGVPESFTPREWVKENGDEGWRARGSRTRGE